MRQNAGGRQHTGLTYVVSGTGTVGRLRFQEIDLKSCSASHVHEQAVPEIPLSPPRFQYMHTLLYTPRDK